MSIFGKQWESLPAVMHKHYANRGRTSDRVRVDGFMKIEVSLFAKIISPFMRLTGALAPYAGENVPVTVYLDSEKNSNAFCLNRIFHYPNRPPYLFCSRMFPAGDNAIIEYMPSGIGWHAAYLFDGQQIELKHLGYKIKALGRVFSIPLELFIGKGYAKEEAINDDRFRMYMDIRHPLFGKVYAYSGEFTITEVNLNE
jgi:hypothetical protein